MGQVGVCRERSAVLVWDVAPSPLCGPGGQRRTDHAAAAEICEVVSCFTSAGCGCMNFPLLVVHLHAGSARQFGMGSSAAVQGAAGAVSCHTSHAHRPGLLGCTGTLVPAAFVVLG